MTIINSNKECQICFRVFFQLDIHHINGNHKDNREKNLIKMCKDCHSAIHKLVTSRKLRKYENESDDKTILKIHILRLKLHRAKYGHLDFFPNDLMTNKVKRIKILENIRKKWEKVSEINY